MKHLNQTYIMEMVSLSNRQIVEEIGKRLKDLRISKNFTQKQLAENAGVSVFTIAQIENGKPVSFLLIIGVMRVLKLLDNLAFLFPEKQLSPIELLNLKTKVPQRVRLKKQNG